eukprot:3612828-Rhodomonas_salina.1
MHLSCEIQQPHPSTVEFHLISLVQNVLGLRPIAFDFVVLGLCRLHLISRVQTALGLRRNAFDLGSTWSWWPSAWYITPRWYSAGTNWVFIANARSKLSTGTCQKSKCQIKARVQDRLGQAFGLLSLTLLRVLTRPGKPDTGVFNGGVKS